MSFSYSPPTENSPEYLAASEAPTIYTAMAVTAVLATVGVVLRCVARKRSQSGFSYDDYMILLALFLLYALNISTTLNTACWGLGRHLAAVISSFTSFQKAGIISLVLGNTTFAAVKSSLLLLYYRIFSPSRRFRFAVYIAAGVVVCYWISLTFATIFQCVPISGFWDRSVDARCVNLIGLTTSSGVLNLLTDVMILCLPIPMVWSLHTTRSQKVSLTGIFLLGTFVCAVSIIRITKLFQVDYTDLTWRISGVNNWTSVEASVGVLCACLPTMRPLFGRFTWLTSSPKRPVGTNPRRPAPRTADKEQFARLKEQEAQVHAVEIQADGKMPLSNHDGLHDNEWVQMTRVDSRSYTESDRRHSRTHSIAPQAVTAVKFEVV